MPLLDLHIGVIVLDLRYLPWHNHLDRPAKTVDGIGGVSPHGIGADRPHEP
ncbi:MAG: hypothetical protein MRJ67_03990 [Nitrospirales bacterium]|nr:hypothetical protein [Nitrospirales bacterium]MDR4482667.1 hypothetical protein [Nitrospirales bacterium]